MRFTRNAVSSVGHAAVGGCVSSSANGRCCGHRRGHRRGLSCALFVAAPLGHRVAPTGRPAARSLAAVRRVRGYMRGRWHGEQLELDSTGHRGQIIHAHHASWVRRGAPARCCRAPPRGAHGVSIRRSVCGSPSSHPHPTKSAHPDGTAMAARPGGAARQRGQAARPGSAATPMQAISRARRVSTRFALANASLARGGDARPTRATDQGKRSGRLTDALSRRCARSTAAVRARVACPRARGTRRSLQRSGQQPPRRSTCARCRTLQELVERARPA